MSSSTIDIFYQIYTFYQNSYQIYIFYQNSYQIYIFYENRYQIYTKFRYQNQMWYLQKSASDSARILSKMALKDTDLWCLTAF